MYTRVDARGSLGKYRKQIVSGVGAREDSYLGRARRIYTPTYPAYRSVCPPRRRIPAAGGHDFVGLVLPGAINGAIWRTDAALTRSLRAFRNTISVLKGMSRVRAKRIRHTTWSPIHYYSRDRRSRFPDFDSARGEFDLEPGGSVVRSKVTVKRHHRVEGESARYSLAGT